MMWNSWPGFAVKIRQTSGTWRLSLTFWALPKGEYASKRIPLSLDHWSYRAKHAKDTVLGSPYLHQFGLRIPETQFDLVNSWPDFQWIGRQVLKSSDVEAEQWEQVNRGMSNEQKKNELADADISSFSLLNHFFKFLPSRIRILSKIEVNLMTIFKCHWPSKRVRKMEATYLAKKSTSEWDRGQHSLFQVSAASHLEQVRHLQVYGKHSKAWKLSIYPLEARDFA